MTERTLTRTPEQDGLFLRAGETDDPIKFTVLRSDGGGIFEVLRGRKASRHEVPDGESLTIPGTAMLAMVGIRDYAVDITDREVAQNETLDMMLHVSGALGRRAYSDVLARESLRARRMFDRRMK